ncbi:topology modulation protein [Planococcus antarcticus DSM 14505]|uniref:Topology modulation protein n=1 Tax=Planococcus antarcticus DSM 14505 TaxID=1185653 RepID=A0AA87IQ42_9BACL|nr:DNA topology modulation protein [Planococcus antarcticus]EIM08432.1 topology modulation protein [Planococcus antarcticus DSM 14505]
MKKIALIGSGGSGKSTLARKLGMKLNVEVYHLDALLWKPNWQPTSKEEQRKIQMELVKKEEWIIDGNYNGTMDIRLREADTIIFLDFSRVLCTYRALKRMIQYRNRKRPDMAEGVKERFDLNFMKWIWNYPKKIRPVVLKRFEGLPNDKVIIILKSPKEAQHFLNSI